MGVDVIFVNANHTDDTRTVADATDLWRGVAWAQPLGAFGGIVLFFQNHNALFGIASGMVSAKNKRRKSFEEFVFCSLISRNSISLSFF